MVKITNQLLFGEIMVQRQEMAEDLCAAHLADEDCMPWSLGWRFAMRTFWMWGFSENGVHTLHSKS